ncbi:MAG: thioredoxin family protein [Balneolaceae bacterium]|nr:thioredoxin family protein [Balneolaceae bacterium]
METTEENIIADRLIENAMSYREYRELIDDLLEKGKTTGPKQSEKMTEYTRMNVQRMNRLDRQVELNDSLTQKLERLDEEWIWVVLTEGWCGDAAQNVPVIAKMANASENVEVKLILRDEHPEIMDQYLTNGTRSIPKLICLDADSLEEIGTWGPRPEEAQQMVYELKDKLEKKEWVQKLHKWYADDKGETIQSDFEELIDKWSSS